ncbi:hypothetical protein Tdes44962_MAKER01016 [Teratosphaeria destructans]|uniref:Uncharacterized protein n=1 Tax=Teratosphaeria destructans TaxID=418781 RepID=A0A9W7SI85_9PEZI|nr:hypothetical protein Tdes44962_MAKER01016 [Teratosphaeria destructans]
MSGLLWKKRQEKERHRRRLRLEARRKEKWEQARQNVHDGNVLRMGRKQKQSLSARETKHEDEMIRLQQDLFA